MVRGFSNKQFSSFQKYLKAFLKSASLKSASLKSAKAFINSDILHAGDHKIHIMHLKALPSL